MNIGRLMRTLAPGLLLLVGACAWGGPPEEQVRSDLSDWYQHHYPDLEPRLLHVSTGRVLSDQDAFVPVHVSFPEVEGHPEARFEVWYRTSDDGRTWRPYLDFGHVPRPDAVPPGTKAPSIAETIR